MPWKETCQMDERKQMILDWKSNKYSILELASIYRVSRQAIYKWIRRYQSELKFEELSRAPHTVWNRTPDEQIQAILEAKKAHMKWGPKKVIAYLKMQHPEVNWPCVTTAGNWLRRHGLVVKRKRIKRIPLYQLPFSDCNAPNSIWSADFKGHFQMGDKQYCYPLTISDNYSRYILQCRGLLKPCHIDCRVWFEYTFREYGLPDAIRTDNGTPFTACSLTGIGRLSKWWIQLGITPKRTGKASPQENGRHERMHRTLKADTTKPPGANLELQQKKFDAFVDEFNTIRPHEALGQLPPANFYISSNKPYPAKIRQPEYAADMEIRKVKQNGSIKFSDYEIYIGTVLHNEYLGLREIDNDRWEVYYYHYPLGILDLAQRKLFCENQKVSTM